MSHSLPRHTHRLSNRSPSALCGPCKDRDTAWRYASGVSSQGKVTPLGRQLAPRLTVSLRPLGGEGGLGGGFSGFRFMVGLPDAT